MNNQRGNIAIILAVLVIVLLGIIGYLAFGPKSAPVVSNTPTPTSTPTATPEWQTYQNETLGFSVRYPSPLLTLNLQEASLAHTLKNYNLKSEKDGSDLGPASDIKITFTKDTSWCNVQGKDLASEAKAFKFGSISGQQYETGAEGMGVVYYCITDSKQRPIFLIERSYLHEAYGTILSQQPDFLTDAKQVELFSQVMATFTLLENSPQTTIKLFFNRTNPKAECTDVVAVERTIPKTETIATVAINTLIQGPTSAEKAAGYSSQIPKNSKLNSLVINNGEALADFNATTQSGGGSCSMAARVAQIRQTLLQFPTVKSAKISIDGKTEDIFQP